ncbi:MAG: imidazole glycerol phosphate synthase subunit HisH [Acidimicrobiales bacterium]
MIAVIDYGIGNLRSAEKALQRMGADARLVTDPAEIAYAEGVVLPGVGAFGPCARALRRSGLDRAALDAVERGIPFLGICVGLQLLYEGSEEDPGETGLGVLPGVVRALPPGVKHPQMQWNVLDPVGDPETGLLAGTPEMTWVYFVHSFVPELTAHTTSTCDYGGPITASIQRGPVWGTQFHPEKSGVVGLGILGNFVRAVGEPDPVTDASTTPAPES